MTPNLPRTATASTPEVSVLVPVRDGLPHLRWTWNTLRRSRGCRLEFVFVDDGSRDCSSAFLDACAEADPRVRVFHTAPLGLVAALNLGLSACRAPWVARLDADDLVSPTRFAVQLARARDEGLEVVGTGIRCFPRKAVAGGLRRYEAWQNGLRSPSQMALERFVESPLVHPSVLFARDLVVGLGGYRAPGWPEDYDLWLRLLAAGARFGKCPEVMTYWRERPDRVTRTSPTCSAAAVTRCKAHHLVAGPLRGRARIYVAGAGDDAKRLTRALAGEGRGVEAYLDLNPRRIGQRIEGVPVCRLEDVRGTLGPDSVILAAIGGAGRRAGVRDYFEGFGLREGVDWICVA
jgi:glycosyltransferase involved in cell wall biosynthesis